MGVYDENDSKAPEAVAEVLGLFGPFQFPELLLQRIWAEQTFDLNGLRTEEGEVVKVDGKGRWNRLGGPDFQEARVKIGEVWVRGDVEVHLREEDWTAHGHRSDPNYANVVLHVVLFPPKATHTKGTDGRRIPIVALLPILWHDLEEYASDAAMAVIAARPLDRLTERWLAMSAADAQREIRTDAAKRWQQKVHYAKVRIDRLGWGSACHYTALEILGYKFNRSPMLQVAAAWPLAAWRGGGVDVPAVFEAGRPKWKLQGVRPANHPRNRLSSYVKWVAAGGDWPERLAEVGRGLAEVARGKASIESGVAARRRELGFTKRWRGVMEAIGAAGAVASPRADNLWGDGLMPLLVAGGHLQDAGGFVWWFYGRPGDQPDSLVKAARRIGFADGRTQPLAWGHVQGLLGNQLDGEYPDLRGT
jgi:hypothetical protein